MQKKIEYHISGTQERWEPRILCSSTTDFLGKKDTNISERELRKYRFHEPFLRNRIDTDCQVTAYGRLP